MTQENQTAFVTKLTELSKGLNTTELFAVLMVEEQSISTASTWPCEELARLVLVLARALQFGHRCADILAQLLSSITTAKRVRLSVPGSKCVDLAEGLLALHRQDLEKAMSHFVLARQHQDLISELPVELFIYAALGETSVLRKKAHYKDALEPVQIARQLAREYNLPAIEADVKVSEAWLHFELRNNARAESLYMEALPVLLIAGDNRRCGDIVAGLARIAQRRGALAQVGPRLTDALGHYANCGEDVQVPNEGRTYIVFAKNEWLLSRQLSRQIEKFEDQTEDRLSDRQIKERQRLREKRDHHLKEAERYIKQAARVETNEHRGRWRIPYITAYIRAEKGDFKSAMSLSESAYSLAKEQSNILFQARGLVQQTMIRVMSLWQNKVSDECSADDVTMAILQSENAIALCEHLQENRIKVKAYDWHCEAALLAQNPDIDKLESLWALANKLLYCMPGDYVTDDHERTRRHLFKAWAQCGDDYLYQLASKTPVGVPLKTIRSKVERIIVLRELEACGGNVTKTALRLTTSPRVIRAIRDGEEDPYASQTADLLMT
jgi:hypothetical protein